MTRCDQTSAWAALAGHYASPHGVGLDLRERFAEDPDRATRFTLHAPEVTADLSKNLWDLATQRLLVELALARGLPAQRDALLRGDMVNATEGRAALHTALRAPPGTGPHSATVQRELDAMLAYAEQVRSEGAFTDVVHIGIGGSDLGPQMVTRALQPYAQDGPRLHFVSNLDGHHLAGVLARLDAARTLFIIGSKTFTTQETRANAEAARAWFTAQGGQDVARHFVAVTASPETARAFGITRTFAFEDWVGGRFSLWSTMGLPVAIAVGAANFRELLAGAHAMDMHFATAPLAANLPVQLGLLDVWYRNFHRLASRSIAPYHQGLARLPAYLQQLEMESNGKCVDAQGQPLTLATSPVVWGQAGTNGQHAFFQMLHQGSDVIPVEFILVRTPRFAGVDMDGPLGRQLAAQHTQLLANGLAQAQALMLGKTAEAAAAEAVPTAAPGMAPAVLAAHRTFPGNRPSTVLLLDELSPRALGALLALYEHRVFTSGAIWGINSFDQWGVELGKALCGALLPRLASGDVSGLDGSTAALLQRLRA
ncbi:MAG: glucose-6-phosphate isomerase [Proteobacteria bacterium]|nr:glucose-6-phosphate isomerase [Pseudomonadota bacterium]